MKIIESLFRLKKGGSDLPSRKDFGYGLDEENAWKNFGNLNLDEAYKKFCEHPDSYQEDFMWMGCKAFEFYLPVLEKYFREVIPEDNGDDCQAWILGCGVDSQLESFHSQFSQSTLVRIRELCNLVLERFSELELDDETKNRIQRQWEKVKERLKPTIKNVINAQR